MDRAFELFNCGEEINKVQNAFKDEDKKKFASCLLVNEDSIQAIINKIESYSKADKNYIIEGFPKNIQQAHLLQKKGVYVKNLLIINIDEISLRKLIENKITALNPGLN